MAGERRQYPVDSAHGVFVVLAAIAGTLCSTGLASALGVYYLPMIETYGKGEMGRIAFATNFPHIVLTFTMPLGALLYRALGSRQSIGAGCAITFAGYACIWAAPARWGLDWLVAMMALVGLGLACVVCSVHCVQVEYFSRYTHAAVAAVSIGSAMGGVLFPRLIYACIERYGWRQALLISAGVTLNLLPVAALLRNNETLRPAAGGEAGGGDKAAGQRRRIKCTDLFDVRIARRPVFLLNTAVAAVWFVGMMVYGTFINALMVERGGMTKAAAATIMSAGFVGNVAGRALAILAAGLVARRHKHRQKQAQRAAHKDEEAEAALNGNADNVRAASDSDGGGGDSEREHASRHGWMPNCGLALGQALIGVTSVVLTLCQRKWSFGATCGVYSLGYGLSVAFYTPVWLAAVGGDKVHRAVGMSSAAVGAVLFASPYAISRLAAVDTRAPFLVLGAGSLLCAAFYAAVALRMAGGVAALLPAAKCTGRRRRSDSGSSSADSIEGMRAAVSQTLYE